ncbi:MAG TPA: glycosyltransferase family 4 protein [Bryobacteraceae bacterium]|nr:glycosyltransferase family 4 protein [Bryobacteraceae bacterium]
MRVVFLNPCGQMGGAETSLLAVLESLREVEPQWDLHLVLGEDGPIAAEARQRGVQVVVEPLPPALARLGDAGRNPLLVGARLVRSLAATVRYRRTLARRLARLHPDIVHTNGFKMHVLGAWACPSSASLIWHIHDYVSTRRVMSRLLRMVQGRCSLAIINSRSVANDVTTVMPKLKLAPVYNAVDLERFSPEGAQLDLDALSGLPQVSGDVVRVGLIGTFARWKGHRVFLQALAQLPGQLNVRGYIIGGPIYQTDGSQWTLEELKREASQLGLDGRVGFTGFVRDAASAIRRLDVVIHASTEPEPFGMVIIEGMACGRAVIASQAGGAAELVSDGENAAAHKPGDARALAEQIERLVRDAEYRIRLGRAGRLTAERLYGKQRLGQELTGLYRRVAGAGFDGDMSMRMQPSRQSAGQ